MPEVMAGSALAMVIIPVTPVRLIMSASLVLPATHSPAAIPEAMFELAAVIASRNVHKPSLLFAKSEVLFTVMVLPAGASTLVPHLRCVGAAWDAVDVAATTVCQRMHRAANTTVTTQIEAK